MATASDTISGRLRYNPETGQYEEEAPPSASEIIGNIPGPSLVNTPMQFGTGADQVPEALTSGDESVALTDGIRSALPEYQGPSTDISKSYLDALGPEPPQPSGYTATPAPVEKTTVKGALKEALKGFIPGYRQMKRQEEARELYNVGVKNAEEKQRAEDEARNWRADLTDRRMTAWNVAQSERYEEMENRQFQQLQWQYNYQLGMLDWRDKALKAKTTAEFTKLQSRNNAFDSFMAPSMRQQGKTREDIEKQRQIYLGPEAYRVFASVNPQERWEATEHWMQSQGWQMSEDNFKNMLHMNRTAAVRSGAMLSDDQVATIGEGIINKSIPPVLTRMYGSAPRVTAYLASRGYDLSQAQIDWTGANRMVTSLNATQPMRIRQATHYVKAMTPVIRSLVDDWKQAGGLTHYKLLNSATLELSMNAGGELGEAASKLDGAIGDLQGEIAIVLMGGYAPTNHSLELAAKNIQANWDEQMLTGNLERIDGLMDMREASQKQITPNVPGGGASAYFHGPGGEVTPQTPNAPVAPKGATVVGKASNGEAQILMKAPSGQLKPVVVSRVEEAKTKWKYTMPTPEEIRGANAGKEKK
jgi:hypothetical protein